MTNDLLPPEQKVADLPTPDKEQKFTKIFFTFVLISFSVIPWIGYVYANHIRILPAPRPVVEIFNPLNLNLNQEPNPAFSKISVCTVSRRYIKAKCGQNMLISLVDNKNKPSSNQFFVEQNWGRFGPELRIEQANGAPSFDGFARYVSQINPDTPLALESSNTRVLSFQITDTRTSQDSPPSFTASPIIVGRGDAKVTVYFAGHTTSFNVQVEEYPRDFKGNTAPHIDI